LGGYELHGFAKEQTDGIAMGIAAARAGDAWDTIPLDDRQPLLRAATPTAKRYAEKSARIATEAAKNGLPIDAINGAATDEEATAIVRAFFSDKGIDTQEGLFEAFGYAKNAPDAPAPVAPAPVAAPVAAPDAPAPDAPDAPEAAPDAPAPVAAPKEDGPNLGTGEGLALHTFAAFEQLTPEQRAAFASAMFSAVLDAAPVECFRTLDVRLLGRAIGCAKPNDLRAALLQYSPSNEFLSDVAAWANPVIEAAPVAEAEAAPVAEAAPAPVAKPKRTRAKVAAPVAA
jgi:hypothetical protein